jgi:hypothetical protein
MGKITKETSNLHGLEENLKKGESGSIKEYAIEFAGHF